MNKNCLSFINIGSEGNPYYNCTKCINNSLTLYKLHNGISICDIKGLHNLGNCLEATILNWNNLATCTKCAPNSYAYYHKNDNINTCVTEVKNPPNVW